MSEEISKITKLKSLERRDWNLWWMAILVIIALTISIIGIQAPQLIGAPKDISTQLKIYLVGLPVLVFLFCIYVIQNVYNLQIVKKQLATTQQEKVQVQSLLEIVKERTEKLQASEANYRTLLERNADAIVVVSQKKNILFLRQQFRRLIHR